MKPQIDSYDIPDIRTSLKEFNTHQGAGRTSVLQVESPDSFQRGAYTASDNALRGKKSVATTD